MQFKLFTSNRLEVLSTLLAERLRQPLSSPFDPEIIVVQSQGMARWISLELAHKLGICANIRFPFPNTFVHEVFRRSGIIDAIAASDGMGDAAQTDGMDRIYDPAVLSWTIMKLLPSCLSRPAFATLRSYLKDSGSELKRFQLASRIADLFDQYVLFRPGMILGWERGEENHWQAELWRQVSAGRENLHRAALGRALIAALQKSKTEELDLPERVSIFGISALPKFHIDLLAALAKHVQVNLFLMNPCREYWGLVRTKREIERAIGGEQLAMDFSAPELYFEEGNSLLSSLGKHGRDFFELIEEFDYDPVQEFVEPGETSLLCRIQSDILNLRDPGAAKEPKRTVAGTDRSIQCHSCHSPRREIEVLHDHLLDLFQNRPDLRPADILVMAPDIESYTPYIQATFDLPFSDRRRIPYSIADRSYGVENRIIESFFAILELFGSRFGAAQVLALLETEAVRTKFKLSQDDLDLIQSWVRETRIRWGQDAQQRVRLGLPELGQNSWRAGLDRMVLGYALPNEGDRLFDDAFLPYDQLEGNRVDVLGHLLDFIETLFEKVNALGEERTLRQWHQHLGALLEAFFESDRETEPGLQIVRSALASLTDYEDLSGFHDKIELRVIKHYLESKLQKEGPGFGFLTGSVTFCSMLPMRSIPAQVICLIGMNNDAYPRRGKELGFDLMAQKPKPGDRSRRHDDRYLFLEALLSAREALIISFVGQDIKDNNPIPPSVLVDELLDTIAANFEIQGGELLQHIKTTHHLQAFSPEYFRPSGQVFSYSKQNLEAAQRLVAARETPQPFIRAALPTPENEFRTVTLSDLYRFFRNPARFLLNKRLRIYFRDRADILEESEPFALQGLDRYQVAQELVETIEMGRNPRNLKMRESASGFLPHGAVGESVYDALQTKVKHFVDKIAALKGNARNPIEVELEIDGFRLVGVVKNRYDSGLLIYRYASVRAKDHLLAWLNHLVLNSVPPEASTRETFLAGVDSPKNGNWLGWRFKPVANSREILAELLNIYWHGLVKPARFYPESAFAFVSRKSTGKSVADALRSAQDVWDGSSSTGIRGEKDDPYFQLCFGKEKTPLDEDFRSLSGTVFSPVFDCQEEIS
ncbi:MAG: exodeoxyribonuclease V subunit gamma [bacterium]